MNALRPTLLYQTPEAISNFMPKTSISTIFLEFEKHILLLKRCHKEDQPNTWGIPGGKSHDGESHDATLIREVKEETTFDLSNKNYLYLGKRFVRIPGWDYILNLYYLKIDEKPIIQLNPNEHSAYEWISLHAFKLMTLLQGQDEAFDICYKDKIWQIYSPLPLIDSKIQAVSRLIFYKGDKQLIFNEKSRFVINLIGTSGSGKGTQGDMLSKIFGIPNISAGDIFRDEFRAKSRLGWMIENYDKNFYPDALPDEIPVGIMAKRLAQEDCKLGFILDGFPRTKIQGETTREIFLRKEDVHVPLLMDVPEADIWERLPGRNICGNCGHQTRQFDENPWPGYCPVEASQGKMIKLEHRIEDVDQSKIERRLKMFRDHREDIVLSLSKRDPVKTFELNNQIPPKEVLHRLCEHIQECLDQAFANLNTILLTDVIGHLIISDKS